VLNGLFRVRVSRRTTPTSSARRSRSKTRLWIACNSAVDTLTTYGFHEYHAELFHLGRRRERQVRWLAEQADRRDALRRATERLHIKAKVMPDEAAFYGPKIDIKLVDAIGRPWQLSTVPIPISLCRAASSWNTSARTASRTSP